MKRTLIIALAAGLVPLAAHAQTPAPAPAKPAAPVAAPVAAPAAAAPAATPAAAAPTAAAPAPAAAVSNVAAVQKAAKDAKVVLEGNLVKPLAVSRYEFRDATGTMHVTIDKKYMPEQKIEAATKVRITGEVEHAKTGVEVFAKKVEIVG